MKCFYHNDIDGICAGAIVYKYYIVDPAVNLQYYDFYPIDHKDQFPFHIIDKDETVIIVDFSLQKDGEFEKLLNITENVTWIDHHKSAIERHNHLDLRGVREVGKAGCVLTWEYFYPLYKIPEAVKYIGDYDIWAFEYGDVTKYFQAGVLLANTAIDSPLWKKLLDYRYDGGLVSEIIRRGRVALKQRDSYYKRVVDSLSFFVDFEGYKAIVCNASLVNSMLFDSVEEDFDIMMPFYFDGYQWTVSVYTSKDNIDCSEIAKKYGGGGHKQAAGFQCENLPFRRIRDEG